MKKSYILTLNQVGFPGSGKTSQDRISVRISAYYKGAVDISVTKYV